VPNIALMLERLARGCAHHRWLTIGAWVAILFLAGGAASAVGPDWRTDFSLPNGEAKDVQDLLEANNPDRAGFSSSIVAYDPGGIDNPEDRAALQQIYDVAAEQPGISVTSPFDAGNEQQISQNGPYAGQIAFATLDISDRPFEELADLGTTIRDKGDSLDLPEGLTVEYGGDLFSEFELPASEIYGVLAAVIILIIAFGSVLAMGLPIGIALFGLGVSTSVVTVLSHTLSMPDFTSAMVAMIGLGVGIDYALFIVTRYREALHAGSTVDDSIAEALDTSGRAVIFAGTTVIIALLGLSLMGLAFVTGVAIASAVGVLLMVIASLTLLPALLGWVGARIDNTTRVALITVAVMVVAVFIGVAFSAPGAVLAGLVVSILLIVASIVFKGTKLRTLIPHRGDKPAEQRFWYRWSRNIQHRPWLNLGVGVVILLALAIPLFSIRLGFGDYGNANEDQTVRRAYDLLADGFGAGTNGPIFITVQGDVVSQADGVQNLAQGMQAADPEGIAFTQVPPPLADDLALIIVYPTTAPQDAATDDLVHDLRSNIIPSLTDGTNTVAKVGGQTAGSSDFASYLAGRMPLLIGVVLLLSFILLMVVFRSLVVPLKAVVMNLLSIAAAYGVLVAIFQWGWLEGIVGVDKSGPIDAWIPMFLFAIVFGLSMDYEVFLLSRIKEEYDRTVRRGHPDNGTAVADGLAITARVITAAALIMFCVFFAFVLGDERALKLFGLGLAVAVLIDATVVRMVLVPSTMELLGDRNWWLPKWLDRILPNIDVEGHHREDPLPSELDEEPETVSSSR
jgi:putative drug exporter of the RND superfamily